VHSFSGQASDSRGRNHDEIKKWLSGITDGTFFFEATVTYLFVIFICLATKLHAAYL
jgi:hypothetical protein